MLMQRLRSETQPEHTAMEDTLDLLRPTATLDDYKATLQQFEAYVGAWEAFGQTHCPAAMQPLFAARQRHPLLVADLTFFDVAPLKETPLLPDLATPAAFLGAMYVMEGSTLGGQLISRHLEKAFALTGGNGYSFFQGHGVDTGRLWKEFATALESQAESLNQDEVVNGAKQMFIAFRTWVERCNGAQALSRA
jgi:heme oxygenase